ncbi:hypothetical protein Pla123a_09300 [Posidoniimonas polymericola]|uniref:Protein-glutamine gamma-glutamyltransferase-like C-terminal domain-containing protein n=1 Tax=Posidoniimonas polymericola TaxID=2528002 RepID=A0A5C5YTM2_9BACT|nr:DUF4129 domain-containing protein [Posidoniimonas polymericola]TWT78140.1 hypothetical protein Pla123a_09300 [Posidoniimonas polymericola]
MTGSPTLRLCGCARLRFCALLLVALSAGVAGADDLTEPDVAIEAGKEALSEQWDLPWYDDQSDDFAPVNLPKPKKRSKPWPIWDWFDGLFSGFGWNFGDVLIFLLWIVVAGLLLWLIVAMIRAYQETEQVAAATAAEEFDAKAHLQRVEALPVTLAEKVDNYLQAARDAYDSGDLSKAIVYLFSHELLELDRAARLRLVKGKTNRQYLSELRRGVGPSPRLADILARTVRLFEAAFFGAHPPTREAFEDCWQEATEFERLLAVEEATA